MRRAIALLAVLSAVTTTILLAADGESSRVARETTAEGYRPDRQTAAHRSGVAAVDSVDLTDPANSGLSLFTLGDRPTLSVSPRATAASATVTVRVAFYHRSSVAGSASTYVLLGVDTATAFTCDVETSAGEYTDETFLFDTYGATHALVLCSTAPSDGTVDLWVGSY